MFINFQENMTSRYFGEQPTEVITEATGAAKFHKRYLYNLIFSAYDLKLPKGWNKNFFRYWLFHFGTIACVNTPEFSWVCGPYGVEGFTWDYQPKEISYSNARLALKARTYSVGENACIIHCFDDYRGFDDIVSDTAEELAQIDKAISINLMNCNAALVAVAKDKKQAEAIKEAYQEATEGKPLVVINEEVMNEGDMFQFFPNIKSSYLVSDLLTARRTILNSFLTKVGIKNANYDKKERLNSQEVEQNNDEVSALVTIAYDNMKKGFSELARLTGEDVSIKLHYIYNQGGATNE